MNPQKGIAKYYIGLIVLVVFAAGLVGYTIAAGNDAKSDKKTSEAVNKIAPALETYINKNYALPADLEELNVNNIPSTVTYKKISDEKYKFCVTYKSSANSFDGGLFSLFGGALYRSAYSGSDYTASEEYLDTYKLIFNHNKGANCLTVKPPAVGGYGYDETGTGGYDDSITDYDYSTSATKYKAVCGTGETSFTSQGTGTIAAIDPVGRTITLAQDETGKPAQIEFDEITKTYDKSCAEIKIGTLKVGDKVKYYGYVSNPLVDVIELQ